MESQPQNPEFRINHENFHPFKNPNPKVWSRSAVAQCLTRGQGAAGLSLTGVTALWSVSKTNLS